MSIYDREHWWEHERFDVVNYFAFRVTLSLLMLEFYADVMLSAFCHSKLTLVVSLTLTITAMAAIFLVMARDTVIRQKADYQAMKAEHDEIRRQWGLDDSDQ